MRLYLSSYRLGNKPEELVKLLKGKRRTALIFNAADEKTPADRAESVEREFDDLRSLGLEPVEVDLREYFGKAEALEVELMKYDLIWVRGGNVFVARRAFRQSGADVIIKKLLQADAVVYGGFSAGIDMLVGSLRGVELADDPNVVPAGYDPEIIWEGLGLLPYAVAPHYKSDHPEAADIDKTVEYMIDHHMPFIALRDGQAIVRDGDDERVVG